MPIALILLEYNDLQTFVVKTSPALIAGLVFRIGRQAA